MQRPDFKSKRNYSFIITVFGLLLFGLVMLYDVTTVFSQKLYGTPYSFVLFQLMWLGVGLLGFSITYTLQVTQIKAISPWLFRLSFAFLVVLGIAGLLPCSLNFIFAPCQLGANRWIYLNPPPLPSLPLVGVVGFQPSELVKLTAILYGALLLEKSVRLNRNTFKTMVVFFGSIAFLILLQPNLSTAVLVFSIGLSMYVVSGATLKPLYLSIPVFVGCILLLMVFSPYRRERVVTFIAPKVETNELSSGYHIKQVLLALGSGGVVGRGLGQSRQKLDFLPEVFADSIFAVIGEELGFIGTGLLIMVFAYFCYKGLALAKATPSLYEKLVCTGVTLWISLQFFINVGAMLKIIPLTGVPLPLISYGGSSLVFMLVGLGVVANIEKRKL